MSRCKVAPFIIIPILVSLITAVPSVGESVQSLVISIDSGGVVYVEIYVNLRPGMNTLKLFVNPITETINIKCDDVILSWAIIDDNLNILSNSECKAFVEYLAKIKINGSTLSFDVKDDVMTKLVVERNIILLSIPEDVLSFSTENDKLIIVFRGPATIAYTLPPVANATTTVTSPATAEVQPFPLLILIGIAIVVSIAVVLAIIMLRKR